MADQDERGGVIPQRPLGRTGARVSALGLGGHDATLCGDPDHRGELIHPAGQQRQA